MEGISIIGELVEVGTTNEACGVKLDTGEEVVSVTGLDPDIVKALAAYIFQHVTLTFSAG